MQELLMVHAFWVKDSLMLPRCDTEGTRQREMGLLLNTVFPNAPDAMGALLYFSKKHIAMTGLHEGKRYPLHTFVFSAKGFDSFLQTLRDVRGPDPKKPRGWASHINMLMKPISLDVQAKPAAKQPASTIAPPPPPQQPPSPPTAIDEPKE
jgi:hypothetical protein